MLMLPAMLLLAWASWLGSVALTKSHPVPWVVHFAVVADPHLYAPALGHDGQAFQEHFVNEVKRVDLSVPLFEQFLEEVLARRPVPDFVLIPGDLTNQGERLSHELIAIFLHRLQARGIAVYVVPGNHDIANPDARSYSGLVPSPAEGIDAVEFERLYADFGYARARSRDRHSLSYIVEPRPGLWLVAIDSCRHADNREMRLDDGRISVGTMTWLTEQMRLAGAEGKLVLAMLHHGALEHFLAQGTHFPDMLIADWNTTAHRLAVMGLRLVFTGHGHAHDVRRKDWRDGVALTDVETSSLVTYPNAYRWAELNMLDARLSLRSAQISPSETDRKADFKAASMNFSKQAHARHVAKTLERRTKFPGEKRQHLVDAITQAIVAHAAGDEQPTIKAFREAISMMKSGESEDRAVGALLASLWHDLPPSDGALELSLRASSKLRGVWYGISSGRRP